MQTNSFLNKKLIIYALTILYWAGVALFLRFQYQSELIDTIYPVTQIVCSEKKESRLRVQEGGQIIVTGFWLKRDECESLKSGSANIVLSRNDRGMIHGITVGEKTLLSVEKHVFVLFVFFLMVFFMLTKIFLRISNHVRQRKEDT